jgi:hypothetical protein
LPLNRVSESDVVFGQDGTGRPHPVLDLVLEFKPVYVDQLVVDYALCVGLVAHLVKVLVIVLAKNALICFLFRLDDIAVEGDSISCTQFPQLESNSLLDAPERVQSVE